MSTPRRRLRLELERLAEYGPLPGWVPWLGLVAVAVALYAARQAGWLGA